ncbi:unnamed protein product, partial [Sphacelaria rigidula]
AVLADNNVYDNGDAGMALMESSRAEVSGNIFTNNKYGVRLSVGCSENRIEDNAVEDSIEYGFYTYEGSDLPEVMDTGRNQRNVFVNNIVRGGPQSIKFGKSDHTWVITNTFEDAKIIQFEDCTETWVTNNSGLDDVEVKVQEGSCFAPQSTY